MTTNLLLTEHQEQAVLMEMCALFEARYPALALLYAIPNGGLRNKATAAILRREGVKAGVPDLCLPVTRGGYNALYIEMKRSRGGVVSEEQERWHERLRREGNRVEVCRGCDEAWAVLEEYLNLGPAPLVVTSAEEALRAVGAI